MGPRARSLQRHTRERPGAPDVGAGGRQGHAARAGRRGRRASVSGQQQAQSRKRVNATQQQQQPGWSSGKQDAEAPIADREVRRRA